MDVGTVVAPAMGPVALQSRATDRETRTLVREAHQRLLRIVAGPASTAPFHRPPTHPATTSDRPARLPQAEH
jgi:hypothetical protein